ncbi:MAG: sporulation integral membrane protein YtvI [Lachnospiraceae bacterium]|nr:sporulation integral membrane protein YtvI [Lachnospiraceae bacterium]
MKKSTKYLKITVNIVGLLILLALCIWVLPRLVVYFMPFVIAGIIALIANPLVRFLEKRVRITRKAGTAVVIIIVIAAVVAALYFIIYNLVIQIIGFIQTAPQTWENTSETIRAFIASVRKFMSRFPLPVREWSDTFLDNIFVNISNWISGVATAAADAETERSGNVGLPIISVIMGILASYFFLADRDYIIGFIERHIPKQLMDRWDLVYKTMKDAVGGYFAAQFKIMIVMYFEIFAGLLILRVKYAFMIAFLVALLDFLPFFGAGAVMIPWAVIKLIQQDYKMAIGLIIIWAIGQAVRQLIQPKLVGDSIGLEPIPTLFFLYIGFRTGGPFGLIVAVPVGMVIINLSKAGVFTNFKYSIMMIVKGFEKMRRFTPEELRLEGIEVDERTEGAPDAIAADAVHTADTVDGDSDGEKV